VRHDPTASPWIKALDGKSSTSPIYDVGLPDEIVVRLTPSMDVFEFPIARDSFYSLMGRYPERRKAGVEKKR